MKQKTKAFRRSIVTKTSHSPAPLKYSIVEEGEEGGGQGVVIIQRITYLYVCKNKKYDSKKTE